MDKKDDTWQEINMDSPADEGKNESSKNDADAPIATAHKKSHAPEESFSFDQPQDPFSAQFQDQMHAHTYDMNQSITAIDNGRITVTLLQELVSLLRPKPFRKRHPIIFWGGILLIITFVWQMVAGSIGPFSSDRIAVVRVEGPIMESKPTLEWIAKLEKMPHVKGILLRIDSPGGGAGTSQEIHGALQHLARTKPVVASMGGSAASGGLMVAMAAQYIVANPSTITGSIGVRMDIPQIYKLLDSFGVTQESITSGKFKDAGSMMRELSPEDRAYFQAVVNDLKGQFVSMIAEGRKKPVEEVEKLADGRVFTGQEALHLGLVDALGGQYVALARLQELTGVSAQAELVEDDNLEKMYKSIFQSMVEFVNALTGAKQAQVEFLY